MTWVVAELAHHIALLPLVVLVWLGVRGRERQAEWWLVAGAYLVSWFADAAAHYVNPWIVSAVYPVSQSALIGAALLPRKHATPYVAAIVLLGCVAMAFHDFAGPDILLRAVCFGAIVALAWGRAWDLGNLHASLMVYFGLGLLAWFAYAVAPNWWTWGAFQLCRVTGLVLFCVAAWTIRTPLRFAR